MNGFLVVAPSTVEVGERFSLKIKALCRPYFAGAGCYAPSPGVVGRYNLSPRGHAYMDNVPQSWQGRIEIRADGGYAGPGHYSFSGVAGPYKGDTRPISSIDGLSFSEPGTKFINVLDPETGITASSNPVHVSGTPLPERLYWGDIHSQTFFSDGLRCPEELYSFAKEEAFLDIFALSDHAESLTDRQWEYFVRVTNDRYEPGRFVTLVGLEWTNSAQGHRNVYYRGDSGPILRSSDPAFCDIHKLYKAARAEKALVVPHHSANVQMGVDWRLGHDPEVERLVEINSVWGNSERPEEEGNTRPIRIHGGEKKGQHVIDALKRGYRFGIIGSGDIHDGRPGDECHTHQKEPDIYPNMWRQGIVGVWAKQLSREAVFDALWNRRVFATTNKRIFLKFSVCGAPMGSEITHKGSRTINVTAASDVPFLSLDIVRNGNDIMHVRLDRREAVFEEQDEGSGGTDWYYARLIRQDGEMAWSSPVWVES